MSDTQKSLTRRDFARSTAIGVGAVTAFNIMNPKHSDAQNPKMKVGVIGTGGRGTGAAQDAMQASENLEIVAVADYFQSRMEGSVESLKRKENLADRVTVTKDTMFGGRDGYKKLLELELDYVIIASPPGFKAEQFEAVVEAGKNCFCEKPVATDAAMTRRYHAAAKKSEEKGLHVVSGLQRRHQQSYVETIAKIHDGELGEVISGRAYWNGTLPWAHDRQAGESDADYQIRNWYSFCWNCGDNIVEQHVHNLDIMNWVFQAHPVSVVASGGRAWKPLEEKYGNIWDNFSCDYEYPGGLHVHSHCRHWNNSANNVSEWVIGSKGKTSSCADMGSEGINPYVQEHINLQQSITGKGKKWNQAVAVCESTFTAILGRMAAYTGQKLNWEDAWNSDLDLMPKDLSQTAKLPWDNIPVPGEGFGRRNRS
jgi:predicted dehydrogenase